MATYAAATGAFTRLLDIIRAEFREMPEMHLTRAQFRRLWALDAEDGDRLLGELVRSGFLVRTPRDLYCRPTASR